MSNAYSILAFLREKDAAGKRSVLVTITAVIGSSSRTVGTQMAVCEDGSWEGSLSGGCTEAAVVGEALRTLGSGKAEQIKLGAGSPFIDIKLPCGGTIDLLLLPDPDMAQINQACQLLEQRRPILMELKTDGSLAVRETQTLRTGWADDIFYLHHVPNLRLLLFGHGEEVSALAAQAKAYGADVEVFTPDAALLAKIAPNVNASFHLKTTGGSPHLHSDPWTACIFLFHDHDWELQLLQQALQQDSFFIGAMGSPKTHASRLAALYAAGVSADQSARIHGPIGLIPSTRDPQTLALSILAQLVAEYRRAVNG